MKNLYTISLIMGSLVISVSASDRKACRDRCTTKSSQTLFFGAPVNLHSKGLVAIEPEPEIQMIENIQQFIAHLEVKLAKYQTKLEDIEQKQATDRSGTKEKHKAWEAQTGMQIDGPPAYVFYEKNKERLRKKIQNTEAKLGILKSCVTR